MAKTTTPQSPDFFAKTRKCIAIGSVTLLKNSSGDRRIKIVGSINLTEDGAGQPDFVSAMFDAIAKESSSITTVKSSVELEGTAMSFFSTNKTRGSQIKATSCTLRTFSMSTKKTRGKDLADVVLSLAIYAPASKELWDWGYDMQGSDSFAEFVPTQMSFGDSSEEKSDEEASE